MNFQKVFGFCNGNDELGKLVIFVLCVDFSFFFGAFKLREVLSN